MDTGIGGSPIRLTELWVHTRPDQKPMRYRSCADPPVRTCLIHYDLLLSGQLLIELVQHALHCVNRF